MIRIDAKQVIKWHDEVIRETGGSSGIRDIGSLESAIASAAGIIFVERQKIKINN